MKRFFTIMLLAAMLCTMGCNKKNVIPDDTLADIFHDAFVANAYINDTRLNLDSLEVYEPIFNRYGYTAKDVIYTVGNFSRRKSARLGTVVEQAISRLEEESRFYSKKVVILDTISNVAIRTFTRKIYEDTLITAKKWADSTNLYIEISPIQPGNYSITYNYTCQGDMDKWPRRAEFFFEDDHNMRSGHISTSLRNAGKLHRTLVAGKQHKSLLINLGKLKRKGKQRHPKDNNITVRNLSVTYKPKEAAAIDSLFKRYVDIKIFADGFLDKKDSLALSPDSTRVSIATSANH